MTDLVEVDIKSPPEDHLGDYRPEHGDPYPATREAHARQTETLPGEAHRDPEEIRQDFTRYGATAGKRGTLTRELGASDWLPNGYILSDGVQSFRVAEHDQHRSRIVVTNHAESGVYLAPTPTRSPGFGALYLPGRDSTTGLTHSREIKTCAEVWLFTPAGFTAGSEPVHLQVHAERY